MKDDYAALDLPGLELPPKRKRCWECQRPAVHEHHPVPRSRGGTRTISLCDVCHAKAHHRDKRMSTSRLTKDALQRKRERGESTGTAPYGWSVDGGRLVPNADERAMMAAARELRETGLSLRGVAAELQSRGMRPRCGRDWHANTVKCLLFGEANG